MNKKFTINCAFDEYDFLTVYEGDDTIYVEVEQTGERSAVFLNKESMQKLSNFLLEKLSKMGEEDGTKPTIVSK